MSISKCRQALMDVDNKYDSSDSYRYGLLQVTRLLRIKVILIKSIIYF